jgi:ubiquinone biosynthesis protein
MNGANIIKAAGRSTQIAGIAVLTGLSVAIGLVRSPRAEATQLVGRALCEALWRLGPAFVKVGQMLSSRLDVLPEELCAELQEGLAFGRAHRAPTAAYHDVGSVALVRRARIDSLDVAVKTIHSGVARQLETDLTLLTTLAGLADLVLWRWSAPMPQIVAEIATSIRRQTDLVAEADALRAMSGLELTLPVAVPHVLDAQSDDTRLVMTWLPGQSGGRAFTNPRRAAKRLVLAVYEMLFVTGTVHCDLHPGNWWELPDGRLAIVDAGFTYELADDIREHFAEFFLGMSAGNAEVCATHALAVTISPVDSDLRASFRADMQELIQSTTGMTAGDFSLARFAGRFFAIQRKHRAFAKAEFIFPFMALLAIEGQVKQLDPGINFQALAGPVVLRSIVARARAKNRPPTGTAHAVPAAMR